MGWLLGLFLLLLFLLLDLGAIGVIIVAIVRTGRRGGAYQRGARLTALTAALALVVLANAGLVIWVISSGNQGRPTPSQLAGTWTDYQGATVQVRQDGNFTAALLPADANDPAGDGQPHPPGGHGTWQIVNKDGEWYVLCTLSSGSRFQLADSGSTSPSDQGTAEFSWVFPQFNAVNIWLFYRR